MVPRPEFAPHRGLSDQADRSCGSLRAERSRRGVPVRTGRRRALGRVRHFTAPPRTPVPALGRVAGAARLVWDPCAGGACRGGALRARAAGAFLGRAGEGATAVAGGRGQVPVRSRRCGRAQLGRPEQKDRLSIKAPLEPDAFARRLGARPVEPVSLARIALCAPLWPRPSPLRPLLHPRILRVLLRRRLVLFATALPEYEPLRLRLRLLPHLVAQLEPVLAPRGPGPAQSRAGLVRYALGRGRVLCNRGGGRRALA